MENYTIVTNNSIVAEFFEKNTLSIVEIKWVATPAIDVIAAAKAAVHQGAVVLSNPLAGVRSAASNIFLASNMPPPHGRAPSKVSSINPYLSVLLSPPNEALDFGSIQRLDEATKLFKKNARLRFLAYNDEAIKQFQAADLEIVVQTLHHHRGDVLK